MADIKAIYITSELDFYLFYIIFTKIKLKSIICNFTN